MADASTADVFTAHFMKIGRHNLPADLLITRYDHHQGSKTRFKKRITNLHVHPTGKVNVYMQCIQLSLLSIPTLSQSTSCFY